MKAKANETERMCIRTEGNKEPYLEQIEKYYASIARMREMLNELKSQLENSDTYKAELKQVEEWMSEEEESFEKYDDNIVRYLVSSIRVTEDMDLIITPKLHVGIIGAALGKSVVSFPEHAYKTSRFYANINEEGRSMRLECVNQDEALRMMEKYAAVPITIDKNVRKLAMENLIPLHSI